jgi:hypothetical protein
VYVVGVAEYPAVPLDGGVWEDGDMGPGGDYVLHITKVAEPA